MSILAALSVTQILAVIGLWTLLRWTIKLTRWAQRHFQKQPKGPQK